MSTPAVAVIGCGNPNRGDDGVGPAVIARLMRLGLPADVGLFDAGTDGMAIMYGARGARRLIIVDARAPENQPGAIYEVPGDILEAEPVHGLGLHAFRWDHALFVGRKLYGDAFPKDVEVFLIEAGSLDYSTDLSEPVARAADLVAERIAARLSVTRAG